MSRKLTIDYYKTDEERNYNKQFPRFLITMHDSMQLFKRISGARILNRMMGIIEELNLPYPFVRKYNSKFGPLIVHRLKIAPMEMICSIKIEKRWIMFKYANFHFKEVSDRYGHIVLNIDKVLLGGHVIDNRDELYFQPTEHIHTRPVCNTWGWILHNKGAD